MSLFQIFRSCLLNNSIAFSNCYVIWKLGKKEERAFLEFSLETLPFNGNFSFLGGINEIVDYIKSFDVNENDLQLLKMKFPHFDQGFFDFLKKLTLHDIKINSFENGTEVFLNEPFIILSGPLLKLKLLSYSVKILLGYSSLICTNSVRMRLVAGSNKQLLEFGLRRAQGPVSGMLASKYSYLGTFDSTSNVYSGMYYNIPVKGTLAHSFIMSYQNTKENSYTKYCIKGKNLWELCLKYREELNWRTTNLNELAAFISFTYVYPKSSLLLVDTYHTINSGVKNFILITLALKEVDIKPIGIRLDSGDLALISKQARALFLEIGLKYNNIDLKNSIISASNDINERSLKEFNEKGHEIDTFGIGTNLVTCQAQPYMIFKEKMLPENVNLSNTFRVGKFENNIYQYSFDVTSRLKDKKEIFLILIKRNYLPESELNNFDSYLIECKTVEIFCENRGKNILDLKKLKSNLGENLKKIREKIEINNRVIEKIKVFTI